MSIAINWHTPIIAAARQEKIPQSLHKHTTKNQKAANSCYGFAQLHIMARIGRDVLVSWRIKLLMLLYQDISLVPLVVVTTGHFLSRTLVGCWKGISWLGSADFRDYKKWQTEIANMWRRVTFIRLGLICMSFHELQKIKPGRRDLANVKVMC